MRFINNFLVLLFFPVVNAIQETKRRAWIIQISVAEHLMKDAYHILFIYPQVSLLILTK